MNNKGDLSSTALQLYIFLLKKNPESSSISSIKDGLGLAKSTIHYNLKNLQKQGLIEETAEGWKVKEFEQLPALRHYFYIFGRILPKYIVLSMLFLLAMVSILFIEPVPLIKLFTFFVALIGFIWTLLLVRRFRL